MENTWKDSTKKKTGILIFFPAGRDFFVSNENFKNSCPHRKFWGVDKIIDCLPGKKGET
jgi:hypothetical protein